jgi:hypothetical protein
VYNNQSEWAVQQQPERAELGRTTTARKGRVGLYCAEEDKLRAVRNFSVFAVVNISSRA